MGKENTIRTGTNARRTKSGINLSTYNLNQIAPSSIYSFATVTYVNPSTKEVIYSVIEDNLGINKTGTALPLYPNEITLPAVGSIIPLLNGPDANISTNAGMYSKTTYYMDPIGVQQTIDNNIIVKEVPQTPTESNINTNKIKSANIGLSYNTPKTPVNNGRLTGEYIFSKQLTTNIWSVVYGGIDVRTKKANIYGAKYMQQQAISAGVINSKNFIFSDYINNISSLTGELQKQYPGASINSVICFSKSGESVWSLVGKYNFVGFMDPSTPSWVDDSNNKTCENPNIRMIYNPSNWGNGTPLSNRLVHVGDRMKKLKTATQTSAGHLTIPQTFYKTYISLF